ncbi:Translation initiation factor IF-1 [Frankliniella fusca]|uniref:Translation initiation factor IF-1 n=1 Tax=Frankliniella fusca TaxID=407009 RepID=A0AAE1GZM0_9NEOP|nr:Translation initiation factor IF-1 [Frankliniella fusca]
MSDDMPSDMPNSGGAATDGAASDKNPATVLHTVEFHNDNPIWKEIMRSMNCMIDTNILRLLKVTGFGSYHALKKFTVKDIEFIEDFVKSGDILDRIEENDIQLYLGFCKNRERFRFMPGEKSLLLEVVEYVKKNHKESEKALGKMTLFPLFQKATRKSNSDLSCASASKQAKRTDNGLETVLCTEIPAEVLKIRKLLKQYCNNKSLHASYSESVPSLKIEVQTVETGDHLNKSTLESYFPPSGKSSVEKNREMRDNPNLTAVEKNSEETTTSDQEDDPMSTVDLTTEQDTNSDNQARCQELSACISDFSSQDSNLSYLLQLLMETARKNAKREIRGRRYDMELKYFSVYLFIVGGPLVYEFLSTNLVGALPSISQVQKTLLLTSEPVREGEFRFSELDQFLTEHGFPRKVYISEDGTRITQKFLFDLRSNQIIGPAPPLSENGIPLTCSFPATSAAMIAQHFEKGTPSSSAYAVMAQPLQDGAPAYCLCMFGIANNFNSEQVYRRWNYIYTELKNTGIEVVGFSSDGDEKLLSAMQFHMFRDGPVFAHEFEDFFFMSGGDKFTVIQDFIHTVNKFRARLSPGHYLPLGKYTASQSHLRILIDDQTKDQPGLTPYDLDKDKMNFNSSVKICSDRVIKQLEMHVPGSEGTQAYPTVMHMKEFLEKVRRIDMLHTVSTKLSGKIVFPRERRKLLLGKLSSDKLKATYFPANEEIREMVLLAEENAKEDLLKLGVSVTCPRKTFLEKIRNSLLSLRDFESDEPPENDLTNLNYQATIDDDDISLALLAAFPTPESVADLHPYDECPNNSQLRSHLGGSSINNIRIHRVREKVLSKIGGVRTVVEQPAAKEKEIKIGNWCLFRNKSKLNVVHILGFKYLSGAGRAQNYSLTSAPVKPPKGCAPRGIGCLGMFYNINEASLSQQSTQHLCMNIDNYEATIPPPVPNPDGKLILSAAACSYLMNMS